MNSEESEPTKDELVLNDLRQAFRAQFGDTWTRCLHKNLRPSPLQEIATRRGVSISYVRKKRAELMHAGLAIQWMMANPEQSLIGS